MSKFEFSPFIDIKISDPEVAAKFYIENFGWSRIEGDHDCSVPHTWTGLVPLTLTT